MSNYIFLMYSVSWIVTMIGAFNQKYNATFSQSIGMSFLGLGALWGASLQWQHELMNYHDLMISTGLAFFSVGTLIKTYWWGKKDAFTKR